MMRFIGIISVIYLLLLAFCQSNNPASNNPETRLSAPGAIAAYPVSNLEIRIAWEPVAGAKGYYLYPDSTAAFAMGGVIEFGGNVPWALFSISPSKGPWRMHYFRVKAWNDSGQSDFSPVCSTAVERIAYDKVSGGIAFLRTYKSVMSDSMKAGYVIMYGDSTYQFVAIPSMGLQYLNYGRVGVILDGYDYASSGGWKIYGYPSTSSPLTALADNGTYPVWAAYPSGSLCSGLCEWLYYIFNDIGKWRLYKIFRDGTGKAEVMTPFASDLKTCIQGPVAPSPNGQKIAFVVAFPNALYTVNTDGSGLDTVITGSLTQPISQPAWSPDSNEIAFVCEYLSTAVAQTIDSITIEAVTPAGTDRRIIYKTSTPPMDLHFSWSADGSRIALTNGHVFVVNKDGSGLEQITSYPVASEGAISWLK